MIFLTGATGFLGSYLADRLLQEKSDLLVLSRASQTHNARERIFNALSIVSGTAVKNSFNLHICEGDVTLPLFGLNGNELQRLQETGVDELWHSAGSISFSNSKEDKKKIYKTNLGGMKNLLRFADEVGVKKIFYISTAYADGNKNIKTFHGEAPPIFNNTYEKSKHKSERMLLLWSQKNPHVKVAIFKPSIVIGDSQFGRAFNFSGYYRYMEVYPYFRNKLKKDLTSNGKIELNITVPGNDDAEINLVFIDYAIDLMMAIRATGATGIFPIVNDRAPTYKVVVDNALRFFGITGVSYCNGSKNPKAPNKSHLKIQKMITRGMADYIPYISWTYIWDIANVRALLGNNYRSHPPFDYHFTELMLAYAVKHDFNLNV